MVDDTKGHLRKGFKLSMSKIECIEHEFNKTKSMDNIEMELKDQVIDRKDKFRCLGLIV